MSSTDTATVAVTACFRDWRGLALQPHNAPPAINQGGKSSSRPTARYRTLRRLSRVCCMLVNVSPLCPLLYRIHPEVLEV